jgi:hypothetical protein
LVSIFKTLWKDLRNAKQENGLLFISWECLMMVQLSLTQEMSQALYQKLSALEAQLFSSAGILPLASFPRETKLESPAQET